MARPKAENIFSENETNIEILCRFYYFSCISGTPLTQLNHVNDRIDTGTLAGKYLIITGTIEFIIQYCLHNLCAKVSAKKTK